MRRNLWESLSKSISVFIASLGQTTIKVLVKNKWAVTDKEVDFEEDKEETQQKQKRPENSEKIGSWPC